MSGIVNIVFQATVIALQSIGRMFQLTYNEVNVLLWYFVLPLVWAAMLDFKLGTVTFSLLWLLLCAFVLYIQRKRFSHFCNKLFRLSQEFILLFGDYYAWSVIICLVVPVAFTIMLAIS